MNEIIKPVIRLCYRKIINNASQHDWDKLVWESTYTEWQLQKQLYDQPGKYDRFSDLLHQHPAAEKLHYLVSTAATGYVKQLNGIMPDITDTLGKRMIPFTQYRFEIINSSSINKNEHSVAISFYSEPLQLHQAIGDHLVISPDGILPGEQGFIPVFTVKLQSFLSIAYLKIA